MNIRHHVHVIHNWQIISTIEVCVGGILGMFAGLCPVCLVQTLQRRVYIYKYVCMYIISLNEYKCI